MLLLNADSIWNPWHLYFMYDIAGAGVARETGTTCALSEDASMLFAERIALADVENKRVSEGASSAVNDGVSFIHPLSELSFFLPYQSWYNSKV